MNITRTINGKPVTITLTDEEIRQIVEEEQRENLKNDIRWWIDDHGEEETDELVDDMVEYINDNEDSDRSLWDNIASAFYFCT